MKLDGLEILFRVRSKMADKKTLLIRIAAINEELVRVKPSDDAAYHKALVSRKEKIQKEIAQANSDYMKTISKKYTR